MTFALDIERADETAIAKREAHLALATAAVAAARAELIRLHRHGDIHDTTLHDIEAELDVEELRLVSMMIGDCLVHSCSTARACQLRRELGTSTRCFGQRTRARTGPYTL